MPQAPPSPVSGVSTGDFNETSVVAHASPPMIKVPAVSDGIVLPKQDSMQPVRKELVADLCKIIEQQSKEIASLRDSAASDKMAPAAATALVAVPQEEEEAAQDSQDVPIAHSEIARTTADEDGGFSSETPSTEDELPAPYGYVNYRKRPTPGLDVLTAAATNIANAKVNKGEDGKGEEKDQGQCAQRQCQSCGTTTTPKWRCGMTLCNACGLRSIKRQTTSRNVAALRKARDEDIPIIPRQIGGNDTTAQPMENGELPAAYGGSAAVMAQRTSDARFPQMPFLSNDMMHLAARQLSHQMRMQSMLSAMFSGGVTQQPMLANCMTQPVFSSMSQPMYANAMCAPGFCTNGMGAPVCNNGMGQMAMFNTGCMPPLMSQQPMCNSGTNGAMCASAVAQPMSLRMAPQQPKMPSAIVNSAFANGSAFNVYMPSCAPTYA